MATKKIRHLDFALLELINREVVSLTGEPHEFAEADRTKIESLVDDVIRRANNEKFEIAALEKASLLVYRLASGQFFHAGNKRTALVAGSAFLEMNGFSLDLAESELVSAVDRAGIAAAGLNDVYEVMKRLSTTV